MAASALRDDSGFLACGIGNFDLDLADNPNHPKRFVHLQKRAAALPDLIAIDQPNSALGQWRETLSFIVISLSLVTMYRFYHHEFPGSTFNKHHSIIVTLKPMLESQKQAINKPAKRLGSESLKPVDKVAIPESIDNSYDATPRLENNETQDASSEPAKPMAEPLLLQVEQIVNGLEFDQERKIILDDGLRTPGLIFDNHLNRRLHSEEIAKFNRWRAPDNAIINTPGTITITKVGNVCFQTSMAPQGGPLVALPLVGNGWNVNHISRVSCETFFSEPTLTRYTIVPTETAEKPLAETEVNAEQLTLERQENRALP